MYGPLWESCVKRILCLVKAYIIPIFWTNLKIFSKSGQSTLFHFVSTCSKKIIHKEMVDSCHGFPTAGLPAMGSSDFFKCTSHFWLFTWFSEGVFCTVLLCDGPLYPVFPSLFTRLWGITARNSIDRLVWEPCRSYAVPCHECSTSVGAHRSYHLQVSSVLQQYMVDDLLLEASDIRPLDSHHRDCLWRKAVLRSMWKKSLPSGNSCEIRTCYVILWFELPQMNEVKNLIVNPRFPLEEFRFSKLLVVSSYFLVWRFFSCTRPPFGSCSCSFSTGGHTTFQHVSGLTVNSFPEFNLWAAGIVDHFIETQWSLHTWYSSQVEISCCAPFSVVTKQNDPAAAAFLCISGVTVQCSSLVRI